MRYVFLFFAGMIAAVSTMSAAQAVDLPIEGGRGGGWFRIKCEPGSFITGFEGRTGAYIDHFRILCAPFDAGARRLRQGVALRATIGLSQGGGPASAVCPPGWGVARISFQNTWRDDRWDDDFVYHINFLCQSVAGTESLWQTYGPSQALKNPPGFLGHMIPTIRDQLCPRGELAVGIAGKSGLYVDALGLICEPVPAAPPPPPQVISPNYQPNTTVTNKPPLGKQAIINTLPSGPAPAPAPAPAPQVATAPPPGPPAARQTTFTGTWDTRTDKNWTYVITFNQDGREVHGSYVAQNGDRGKIKGKVRDGVLEFKWEQDGGFEGTGQFALAGDGRSFSGTYRTDPNKKITDRSLLQGTWSGTRR